MTDLSHWEETDWQKHQRVNEILKINSAPPQVCVSCLEVISDRQTAIPTPYGPYHGYPMTCVEGRDDADIPWYQK